MINFLNLEYFLAVAEELNITRAAKQLYISQQSLSSHISNLEKEFDVQLFNRTMPLTLTYAGRALKVRAKQMLDLKDETYRELADIKDFTTGQLSIGISHTRGRFLLPATSCGSGSDSGPVFSGTARGDDKGAGRKCGRAAFKGLPLSSHQQGEPGTYHCR